MTTVASPDSTVILGLGSNLGDRDTLLKQAVAYLNQLPTTSVVLQSTIQETDPVEVLDQPCFLNQLIVIETQLAPEALLAYALAIEVTLGRVRNRSKGPRTIDVDLLFYENVCLSLPHLTLPHPRAFDRAFIVEPMCVLLKDPWFSGKPYWEDLAKALRKLVFEFFQQT